MAVAARRGRTLGTVSWRFLSRPKWIVRHGAVGVLVVTMVLLGLWQLRRLEEKRDLRATVEARQAQAADDVQDVVPAGARVGDEALSRVEHRRVTATGEYANDDTFVVENRSFNGASGAWVLTPLVLPDGSAIVVSRGFVGFNRAGEIEPPPAPPGEVEVEGVLLESEQRGRFGASDPDEGELTVLARVDLPRVAEQVDHELLPAYLQRVSSEPEEAPGDGAPELVAIGLPEASEGPHLSYAVQWFIFTTIAVVGYVLLLRRVARDEAREEAARAADAELDRELQALLDAEA
jgi:cytochrome oxidase assembly protein ShyY1